MLQLRISRIVRGLTLWELSRQADVPTGRLSMIERGLVEATEDERQRIAGVIPGSSQDLFKPAVDSCSASI